MKTLKEKGITLVALSVTIIILLMLAGVTIAQISGEDGLFSRVKKAVGDYQSTQSYEEQAILEFEKYVTDFTITGGDEEVALKIVGVEAKAGTDKIDVVVEIEGTASKIEYSIDYGETWKTKEDDIVSKKYTFEQLKPGSYIVKVRAYDEEGRYQEATSNIVTVIPITTAEEKYVLEGKTYLTGEGELKAGNMAKHETVGNIKCRRNI